MMGANIVADRGVFYAKAAYLLYIAVFLRILRGVAGRI